MQMKEKICLTELLLGRIIGASYQPESKRASVQWKHPSSHSAKKFKVTPSAYSVLGFSGSEAGPFAESS
jgi:hypothetical protein